MLADKLVIKSDIDSLLAAIAEEKFSTGIDRTNRNRFPVRFILLNSFAEMREITERLVSNSDVQLAKIEDSLLFEDGWLTWQQVIDTVEKLLVAPGKDSILAPFSELIRFYNTSDLRLFISNVISKQSNKYCEGRRVYLPIVGLEGQRELLFAGFDALPPLFCLKSNKPVSRIKLWIVPYVPSPIIQKFSVIESSKQWLEHWRKDDSRPMLCSSNTIKEYSINAQEDSTFDISVIKSPRDFIVKVLGFSIPFEEKENEVQHWDNLSNKLLAEYNAGKCDFYDHFCTVFKCNAFEVGDFVRYWFSNPSDRWFLVRYSETVDLCSHSYLALLLGRISEYKDEEFVRLIGLSIFDTQLSKENIEERKRLLKSVEQNKPQTINLIEVQLEKEITAQLHNGISLSEIVRLFCGLFSFEKRFLLNWFSQGGISFEQLSSNFKGLSYYLNDYSYQTDIEKLCWVSSYMKAYRQSRLLNSKAKELEIILEGVNGLEDSFFDWYLSLHRSHDVLSKSRVDRVIWFDGLGVEWMPLISGIVNEREGFQLLVEAVCKNNLPSSTEHNRWKDVQKIDSLDPKYIHSNLYSHPKSLIDQIEIVTTSIGDVMDSMNNETIAIVSDHGFTFLPKYEDPLGYKIEGVSHEGRYVECSIDEKSDGNFVVWKSNDGKTYKVALRHKSLTSKPTHEVHGGCTPEECIVPVIIITNKKSTSIPIVEVLTSEITAISRRVALSIISSDNITSASYSVNGIIKNLNHDADGWHFNVSNSIDADFSFDIIVNGIRFSNHKIIVKKAVDENEMF